MKKLVLVPLSLILLVFASAFALADEGSTEDLGSEESGFMSHFRGPIERVKLFMEEHGLTEDNSIADLFSAMETEHEERLQEEMDAYGVDSLEELQEAKKAERIEKLREKFGLSEDATEEEVLAAAQEARLDKRREFLGLDESASAEEVHAALQAWNEEHEGNRPFSRRAPHRGAPQGE